MSYTVLKIDERGVWFREHHARRLAPDGGESLAAFDRFCAAAEPGIWAVWLEKGVIRAERRAASRLRDGMPVRFHVSPFAQGRRMFQKPAPPNAYASVRADGMATLLTDAPGSELYESCSAAIIAWTPEGWCVPPRDRPRVDSVAERALWAAGLLRESPIRARVRLPLALVNAVVGVCTLDPAQVPTPAATELARVQAALSATAR